MLMHTSICCMKIRYHEETGPAELVKASTEYDATNRKRTYEEEVEGESSSPVSAA
jgi:hypothetical protein